MKARITASKKTLRDLSLKVKSAFSTGNLKAYRKGLALMMVFERKKYVEIAKELKVHVDTIRRWVLDFLCRGTSCLFFSKSPGRPSKLTKKQKMELVMLLIVGPEECGFTSSCWNTPMIQHLILEKFGVFYSANYLSNLLKSLGFSYQKAKFVSDHLNEENRNEWLNVTWKKILKEAEDKSSYVLFGDEASFPQWGTLSYTWSPVGTQPTVKTSGKRKGYKVFGFIDYFTGKFFYKTQESRLNSKSYIDFIKDVLSRTKKHLIIIQDGARYHMSKEVNKFFESCKDRMSVYQLPSYSPDFNPIEKLWKKIKRDATHLKYFPTFENLKGTVEEVLEDFKNSKDEVLSLFGLYDKRYVM